MSLSKRIADALTSDMASAEVDKILQDVRSSIEGTDAKLDHQRALALDPTSTDDVVAAARRSIEDLQFTAQRMQEAHKRLTMRLSELVAAERKADEDAKKNALLARQKAIREQFLMEYPVMARRIASLAMEMVEAGIEAELPKIHLGDGPSNQQGSHFNYRRYWPRPQQAYEHPAQSVDHDLSGKVVVLRDTKEHAA